MKNYLAIAIFVALCLACKLGSTETSNNPTTGSSPVNNSRSENPSKNANHPATTPKAESGLSSLKTKKDKTATEIKLWQNKEFTSRLEKLMGADYKPMKENWNVETPMEVEGDVLKLTGCEQHNCGDNQYWLYIDTATDNINVFHNLNGKLTPYKEKGEIKLPKNLAEDFKMNTSDLK